MSTPRPQEAEELAVSSPLGVTSVVINCLQGLIKKFCCASLPVLFDPLQFAYRPNGTPGDALAHLDTLDICVDAVRGLQLCSQHPGSSQAGPVLELCLQVPTRLATGVPGHSLLQHHCEVWGWFGQHLGEGLSRGGGQVVPLVQRQEPEGGVAARLSGFTGPLWRESASSGTWRSKPQPLSRSPSGAAPPGLDRTAPH